MRQAQRCLLARVDRDVLKPFAGLATGTIPVKLAT